MLLGDISAVGVCIRLSADGEHGARQRAIRRRRRRGRLGSHNTQK